MAYSILCVDDEQLILLFLKRALEHTGYTIYTADDGVDALDKIKEHRPDLVFLDVAMPEMSGDEALPLIHEIDPTIAVIIISGKVSKLEARDLLAKGAFDFLEKPMDVKHLLDVVEHWRFVKEAS